MICTVLLLSPDGEKGSIGKALSFIGALILVLVMIGPLPSVLKSKISIPKSENEYTYEGEENTAAYYGNMVGRTLMAMYGCEASDIRVRVLYTDDGEIELLTLYVSNAAVADDKEAGQTLSSIYGINIEVETEG